MAEAIVKNTPGAITPRNEAPKPMSTDKGSTSERQTPTTGSKTNPTASKTGKGLIKTANKPPAPPKSDTLTPTQLNKEVFSVLKELNENYKQQNARIDQQNARIESLSRKLDTMYEDSENYDFDNYNEGLYDDDCVIEPSGPSPAKKQKTEEGSIFKSLATKFQSLESVASATEDDELAEFVNTSFRNGITDDKQAELVKDIRRPANTESLQKTRINQGIGRLLKSQTQTEDSKMQAIQNLIIKASVCQVKLFDRYADKFEEEDVELLSNSIVLLGQSNKLINTKRKEMHKGD